MKRGRFIELRAQKNGVNGALHIDDLNVTVFSDEKTFGQDLRGQKERIWLNAPAPFDQRRMVPTHAFGGVHIKLWAAITNQGFLAYKFFEGQLDSASYSRIIKDELLRKASVHFGPKVHWTFQQDNASWHLSDSVADMLERKEIHIMHWPPHSPDLNLIENVWPEMNRRISHLPHATKGELKIAIETVIKDMNREEPTTQYFKHLYESFRHRLEQVIKSGGLPIDY